VLPLTAPIPLAAPVLQPAATAMPTVLAMPRIPTIGTGVVGVGMEGVACALPIATATISSAVPVLYPLLAPKGWDVDVEGVALSLPPLHMGNSTIDGQMAGTSKQTLRRPWTSEEDEFLRAAVDRLGAASWSEIAKVVVGRTGKQCRERWHNQISPSVRKSGWTEAEDRLIVESVAELGTRWSEICKRFDGRSDNDIKNRYNACKRAAQRRAAKGGGGGEEYLIYMGAERVDEECTAPTMLVEARADVAGPDAIEPFAAAHLLTDDGEAAVIASEPALVLAPAAPAATAIAPGGAAALPATPPTPPSKMPSTPAKRNVADATEGDGDEAASVEAAEEDGAPPAGLHAPPMALPAVEETVPAALPVPAASDSTEDVDEAREALGHDALAVDADDELSAAAPPADLTIEGKRQALLQAFGFGMRAAAAQCALPSGEAEAAEEARDAFLPRGRPKGSPKGRKRAKVRGVGRPPTN